jgi:hypothetical protein
LGKFSCFADNVIIKISVRNDVSLAPATMCDEISWQLFLPQGWGARFASLSQFD